MEAPFWVPKLTLTTPIVHNLTSNFTNLFSIFHYFSSQTLFRRRSSGNEKKMCSNKSIFMFRYRGEKWRKKHTYGNDQSSLHTFLFRSIFHLKTWCGSLEETILWAITRIEALPPTLENISDYPWLYLWEIDVLRRIIDVLVHRNNVLEFLLFIQD